MAAPFHRTSGVRKIRRRKEENKSNQHNQRTETRSTSYLSRPLLFSSQHQQQDAHFRETLVDEERRVGGPDYLFSFNLSARQVSWRPENLVLRNFFFILATKFGAANKGEATRFSFLQKKFKEND
jgi:hypothetical protein